MTLSTLLDRKPLRRIVWLKCTLALTLISEFAVAPRLWLSDSFFGPIPVFDWIPSLASPFDWIILGALAVLLGPIAVLKRPGKFVIAWCVLFFSRSVWDEITWQPYFLQFFVMMASLAFVDWSDEEGQTGTARRVLNVNRLIFVAIYFWSGVAKFHYKFITEFISGTFSLNEDTASWGASLPWWLGAPVPVIETLLAVALVSSKYRAVGVLGLSGMHVLILAVAGPTILTYNQIIWPWNVAMILFLFVLFWGDKETQLAQMVWIRAFPIQKVALVFFVLCPLLSYVGLWTPWLSFRLFAMRYYKGYAFMKQSVVERMPVEWQEQVEKSPFPQFDAKLSLTNWPERELKAFPPWKPSVFKELGRRLGRFAEGRDDLGIIILDPPHFWTGERQQHRYLLHQLE